MLLTEKEMTEIIRLEHRSIRGDFAARATATIAKRLNEEAEADLATAQAQVAVMAEAIELALEARFWVANAPEYKRDWNKVKEALSAAPKVVGRWEGKWEIHDDELWLKIFTDRRIASCNMAPRASWDNEPSGNDMQVFIVDKQGEGE